MNQNLVDKVVLAIAEAAELHGTFSRIEQAEAVLKALGADETRHKLLKEDDRFSLEHPLAERLDGHLFDCSFHLAVEGDTEVFLLPSGLYWAWVDESDFFGKLNLAAIE